MSFSCPHCHLQNTEIQSAGEIQALGSRYTFKLQTPVDLQRQIVKSDTASFRINDLDIEMPPGRGKLTNVEGMISGILSDLELGLNDRWEQDPETAAKLTPIVDKLKAMTSGESFPFSISLDDPAGNSSVEPSPQDTSSSYTRNTYIRTVEQNESLGLAPAEPHSGTDGSNNPTTQVENTSMNDVDIIEGEIYSLPTPCPGCMQDCEMNIQMVNIPHFKQVIISAITCSACGYRTNDVKTGGKVPDKGTRTILSVEGPEDLKRDILKGESCSLRIPECELQVEPGTMGGRFTTVEGLIVQIRDDLKGAIFDVDDVVGHGGDGMADEKQRSWHQFFGTIDKALRGEVKYTIVMEDPLGGSYVQKLGDGQDDPQVRIEEYERTAEENEDLGIDSMKTVMGEDGEYEKDRRGEVKKTDGEAKEDRGDVADGIERLRI